MLTAGYIIWYIVPILNAGRSVWEVFVVSMGVGFNIFDEVTFNDSPWLDSHYVVCFYLLTGHDDYTTNGYSTCSHKSKNGEVAVGIT